MSFDWLLYLSVSDDLIKYGTEAHARSAVSRAYYGAFGIIRQKLEEKGIRFNATSIHHDLINWLRESSDIRMIVLGLELDNLRAERNRADYYASYTLATARAQKSLDASRRIEANIKNL